MKQNAFVPEFTLDHYPPKSVGGTKTLLVCRICNSTHGSKEDHAIKTHLQLRDFLRMKEGATFPITVKYEGVQGNYKVLGKWQNKTLTQILNFEHAPLVRKKLDEYAATKQSWSFQIHGKAPSRKTLYKALLRTAYLTCFSKWGYDFFAANLLLCRRTLLYIVKLLAALKEFYGLAQQACRKIQYLKCRL